MREDVEDLIQRRSFDEKRTSSAAKRTTAGKDNAVLDSDTDSEDNEYESGLHLCLTWQQCFMPGEPWILRGVEACPFARRCGCALQSNACRQLRLLEDSAGVLQGTWLVYSCSICL